MSYLTSLFIDPNDPSLYLYGSHNPWLVALSLLIAVFASGMALQVAGMARLSDSRLYRQVALGTGSLALGGGVWSMHFIGMLAFQLCARVDYAPGLTLLSLLPSFFASWVALQLLARRSITTIQLVTSGVLVGAGIGAMHYSGMAAMEMAPLLRYDPYWFALSIVVAVVLAILALWVRFGLRGRISGGRAILASSVVMGLAIAGMHYTGMAAARFIGSVEALDQQSNADSVFIALAVALITVSLTIFVAATNGLLRYRQLFRQMQGSELRLRGILETAVDGIVIIDDQGLIEGLNAAAERLYGWSKQELIGRHINTVIPESYHQGALDYLPRVMLEGQSDIIGGSREVDALLKDGSLLPIRLAIGLAKLPNRTLYVGFISDISARKGMEQALRESEQQYRSLIGNIPGVSFRCLLDDDWTMLFISDAVETLTGWTADDFMSQRKSISELYHPEDFQRVAEQVLAAIGQGHNYTVEYRLYDRQGVEHWIWESGSAVLDEHGKPTWIDGVLLDITENKLRNAEFESTVTAIRRALLVVEFDLQGTILDANQNFLDLTGYQLEEVQGQHHRMFCEQDYVESPEYAAFWARLGRGELDAGEYLRLGKGGREVWIQASYNPIFDADGKPFKVIKFATDLSQRREMEGALREAKEVAEQAAAAKTTFLANMSHEIRTPMNAIIGFTELLLGGSLESQQRRHLGTVRQAARSLLGLLNGILDTAKLERGAVELERVDFSLRELCQQICDSLRLSAEAKGLTLELDYPDELGAHFKGDSLRIQQVLTNLVGNAVKFTERGWVRLELRAGQGDELHFAVRDSGIGIAADRLQRIFEPFAQADASMSRRFGGTGLGTTIARQLTELMGGRIEVESQLGEGTTFHVHLSLPAGLATSHEPSAGGPNLPPLRILAADDVPQNIELLSLILSRLGHSVVTAYDGEEALTAFHAERFDLLLMDVQMPRVDGLEATRRIRRHEQVNGLEPTPIIALTASVLEQDRRAAREAGMDGFASKPLEMDKLLAEIAAVLGLAPQPSAAPAPVVHERPTTIDWPRGIALWGSESALLAAIRRFLHEHGEAGLRIAELLHAGDQAAAIELTHRVRGAAANLALLPLSRLAGQLEHALKGAVPASTEELLAALGQALASLPGELPELPPAALDKPAAGAVELQQMRPLIEQSRTALQHGELAEQALQQLLDTLPARQAQALEAAINNFDFERADALLAELLGNLEQQSGAPGNE
ncbi:PAS domain S-box protein [Aquipseudomonas ullengensis]|uniref:histidine kinase n=1 Tax=Aquipseudomonas ullengensis TaxID=2759166 RepID=A0A7W4LN76_9GAMM|nr:PAS domain S-box protein [Pseudomonas ullengensis]MBB2496270.1 PAS domain S-box protein [Pseudomonas ullengensis]